MENPKTTECELNQPIWSVVNAYGVTAPKVTYPEASAIVERIEAVTDDPSIVIVTADVAARIQELKR